MKKKFKKLKAMTLVEVLVALAIFTIMSSLLASAVAMVCNITKKTDSLNKKISYEAPNAEKERNGVTEPDPDDDNTIHINLGGQKKDIIYRKYVVTDPNNYYENGGDFSYLKPGE